MLSTAWRRLSVIAGGIGLTSLAAAAPAQAGFRIDDLRIDIDIRGDHGRHRHEHVERVWVEPVYRTVCDRVWVPPVYEERTESVWVPEQIAYREVVRGHGHHRRVERVPVCVEPGHYERRVVRVEVCAGYWKDVTRQELVRAGYWEVRGHASRPPEWRDREWEHRRGHDRDDEHDDDDDDDDRRRRRW